MSEPHPIVIRLDCALATAYAGLFGLELRLAEVADAHQA